LTAPCSTTIHRFTRVNPPAAWKGETVNLTFRMKEEDDN